ncbi:MAG: zinc metalloprotease HtpX [Candidatus Heimdallarchaeota archaeon]
MGLKLASTLAILFLFGLIYAVVFVIGVWFLPNTWWSLLTMVGFTIMIILFQYGISPLIVGWLYRIDWIPYEQYIAEYPHLGDAINKVVAMQRIKPPKLGIIFNEFNPNAFTYGWTKNSARLVITEGILEHLDEREQTAVVAHELGHIVHNDFILMTVVFAIPLILLTIARWSFYVARFSGIRSGDRDKANYLPLILIVVAVVSYLSYYLGYLVSLVVSRIREYYADQHSAELTEDPNTLSTALVKIAYGLLVGGTEAEIKERNKSRVRALRGLGIFDPKKAHYFAMQGVGASGEYSKRAIEAAAGWDLFNPWAKYFQIFSTHPLPAKRIQRLNELCEIYGKSVEIDFSQARKIKEEQIGKSMIGEFLTDIFIKSLPSIVFFVLIVLSVLWLFATIGWLYIGTIATVSNLILMWATGFFVMGIAAILRTSYMYRKGFEPATVLDLVTQINVSPVRPIPAIIEGTIIGKGIPGYIFSNDLYFQDETGLMYIDYRFGLSIVDFFWAITKVNRLIGQRVRIKGWYRRGPGPYLQIDTLETEMGRRHRNYSKHMTYILAIIFFIISAIVFYFWFATYFF